MAVYKPCLLYTSLEFVLVKEVIPFIDYRLEPAATDGFGFLGDVYKRQGQNSQCFA